MSLAEVSHGAEGQMITGASPEQSPLLLPTQTGHSAASEKGPKSDIPQSAAN
jgi:hypothetical protein